MNIKEQVLANRSKMKTISIVNYIGYDKQRFKELVDLFLGTDKETTQRSAWVYSYCIEANPDLITPFHALLIKELGNKKHNAILRRAIMKAYQIAPIPTEYESLLFDISIKFLIDSIQPVTVKVYSMATALRIAKRYPELKNELKTVIEAGKENGSPAYLAWSRKILKEL